MRVTLSKTNTAEHVYISKAYRNDEGKSTSRIMRKLGTMEELLPLHGNDRELVLAWAREEARAMTEAEKEDRLQIPVSLSEDKQLRIGERTSFNIGYLFLQKIFYQLGLGDICGRIASRYEFEYDLTQILSGLICSRILSPSSKRSSYRYLQELLETPSYELHDVYRALDVLEKESGCIQSEIYEKHRRSRNTSILYYDCTNFFFETEEESGMRRYGKSKEHRPLPLVQMGLFLDADGIPLAFTVFPGNESEQPSLIPIEKRILKDFELSRFIVCTDAGLASAANRRFNDRGGRSFVVTQSLKMLKAHLKEWALDPKGWSLGHDERQYDLSQIDEETYKDAIFHKERWINENGLQQRMIVSFSPRYKAYQRQVRQKQIERASAIISRPASALHNPNSPTRFIEEIQMTIDGELAEKTHWALDLEKIRDEERYDGFAAVCTTLEDDVQTILRINKQRWEIEESFRIMKSEFKARPVYHQKDDRIRAHFLTCFLALLVYRTLERELDERYTLSEITSTLRKMNLVKLDGLGYMPCYTRTEVTDALHERFGMRTDREIVLEKKMKKILKDSKKPS